MIFSANLSDFGAISVGQVVADLSTSSAHGYAEKEEEMRPEKVISQVWESFMCSQKGGSAILPPASHKIIRP